MCACIYMKICKYVCIYENIYLCIKNRSMYKMYVPRLYVTLYVCIYVCMYLVFKYKYTYLYMYLYLRMNICIYIV